MKILIIDDDPLIRHIYQHYFEHKECTVLQAADGKAGMQMIHDHPDVTSIILDVHMPVTNGFEFLVQLCALENVYDLHPDIYFISDSEEHYIQDRIDHDLMSTPHIKKIYRKPVDLHELYVCMVG